jgi:hypothetical protein
MTILDNDIPLHLREPKPCRRCSLSSTYKPGTGVERMICIRTRDQNSCTFERHESGVCGPEGKFWTARNEI